MFCVKDKKMGESNETKSIAVNEGDLIIFL